MNTDTPQTIMLLTDPETVSVQTAIKMVIINNKYNIELP